LNISLVVCLDDDGLGIAVLFSAMNWESLDRIS